MDALMEIDHNNSGAPEAKELRKHVGTTVKTDAKIVLNRPIGKKRNTNAVPLANGMFRASDDGYVWNTTISSEGANGIRIHFTDFDLPENASMFIYNDFGQAFGPYEAQGVMANGDFWSHTLKGDTAYIQVHYFGAIKAPARFTIADVGHMTDHFRFPGNFGEISNGKAHCNVNASCVQNAGCTSNSIVSAAKDGVAHMLYQSGGGWYICSGGLLNNTNQDGTDLFLTANHCLSTNNEASTLETYFFYASACGQCVGETYTNPSTIGATVLSSSGTSDYTLLQLSQSSPGGVAYLGWSTAPVAYSNGTSLYRIHHPSGAPQSYSEHSVDTSAGTCFNTARGNWIYSRDTYGAQEGGSSGSPVLNSSGQVVGQLTGACGSNYSNVCDSVNNATIDGALAAYYNNVSQWLDPGTGGGGNTMHVDSIVPQVQTRGSRKRARTYVYIDDQNGSGVSQATVSVTFSGSGLSQSRSGTTNNSGRARITSGWVTTSSLSYTVCVDNVTHASYTYDDTANNETCDGI
ncbi:MAG: serine protease [Acidobacteriota bacterium]|nr:serine protease [Acidobacteriota bacterium]